MRLELGGHAERGGPVVGSSHSISGRGERFYEHVRSVFVVVNDKDADVPAAGGALCTAAWRLKAFFRCRFR